MFDKGQKQSSTLSCDSSYLRFFTIYGHGNHLGHVTSTIDTNFSSPFLRMLHMKFGIDWTRGFREEDL